MSRRLILLTVLCLAAGVGAFVATWAAGPGPEAPPLAELAAWLKLSPEQVAQIKKEDPTFAAEAAQMSATLRAERLKLASLLETAEATDAQVLAQLDKVNTAENTLEGRVARYVLRIRHHLDAGQQKKLLGLVARGLREGAARHLR
jgi:hypothetical protein